MASRGRRTRPGRNGFQRLFRHRSDVEPAGAGHGGVNNLDDRRRGENNRVRLLFLLALSTSSVIKHASMKKRSSHRIATTGLVLLLLNAKLFASESTVNVEGATPLQWSVRMADSE